MTTYYKLDHSEPGYLSQMLPRADGTWVKRADYYADLAADQTEIERLTKERDEARAQVDAVVVGLKSLVSVVQGYQQMPGFSLHPMVAAQIDSLAQTSISDYKSAIEAYGREKVREGMQRAADIAYAGKNSTATFDHRGQIKRAILADMETLK